MKLIAKVFFLFIFLSSSVLSHAQDESECLNEQNSLGVVECFRLAAEQGDAKAQYSLGQIYAGWDMVERDSQKALMWYRKAAENGHTEAQYTLAVIYDSQHDVGHNDSEEYEVEPNDAEAAKWYGFAAEKGYANAQYYLGRLNNEGRGVSKDDTEAVKWFRKAAEQGYPDAQYQLGEMLAEGCGTAKNSTEAVNWFKKAAELGHRDALDRLWEMYTEGRDVKKDSAEALKWLKKAADQGYPDAQYILGTMYEEGRGVARNDAEAANWFMAAAEQEHAPAQNKLGTMYAVGRGVAHSGEEARKWFSKAAESWDVISQNELGEQIKKSATAGDAKAQTILGLLYRDDVGYAEDESEDQLFFDLMYAQGQGIKQNTVEAAKMFRKAAEQGFAPAQYYLGNLYYRGRGYSTEHPGIDEDKAEALKWLLKAAKQNNAAAQYSLMWIYENGYGVKRNNAEAEKWLRKSAENGYVFAQTELGKRYTEGVGVAKNYTEAKKWLEKAVKQGDEQANKALEYINLPKKDKDDFACHAIAGEKYAEYVSNLLPLKVEDTLVCIKEQNVNDYCRVAAEKSKYISSEEKKNNAACRERESCDIVARYLKQRSSYGETQKDKEINNLISKFANCSEQYKLLLSREIRLPKRIVMYSITKGRKPVKTQGGGFISENENGYDKIVDITALDVDGDGKKELIVINEVHLPGTVPSFNNIVTVFDLKGGILSRNKRASEWFGSGDRYGRDRGRGYGDMYYCLDSIYRFPYWNRIKVEKGLALPYASLIARDGSIPVTARRKSYLHELPAEDKKTEKYLISGDKATVDKYTAGWCRINYPGGKKPLQMWVVCEELLADGEVETSKCPEKPLSEKERKLLQMMEFSS